MNTANKNGILFGLLCPGELRTEREPVAYLYNGVRLPKLPEWDKTVYPYAVINRSSYNIRIYLCADIPCIQLHSDGTGNYLWNSDIQYLWSYTHGSLNNPTYWHELREETATPYVSVEDVIWTNFDLYDTSEALRFAASEPVPIYEDVDLVPKYTELAYIESSGTQYIDTGFTPNQDTRIDIVAMPIDTRDVSGDSGVGFAPYGAAESYNKRTFECYNQRTESGRQFQFGYGGDYFFTGQFVVEQITSISQDKNRFSITNAVGTWSGVAYEYTFTAPDSMWLFGTNRPRAIISGPMRIYSCQIYDNGTLIRDFVPCKTVEGEIGLWDKVDGKFYRNVGTGEFVGVER